VGSRKIRASQLSALGLDELYNDFELSETKVTRMAQLHVAFIRHVGPYEAVTDILWHRLADWAKSKRLPVDLTFLGIAQDSPGLTAPERLRFDAGIVVPEVFSSEGAVGHQVLNAAEFAVTTHVGHYRTLPEAYATIVRRAARLKGYRVGGLPCIEVYRTTRVDANHEMNLTEIYIPVSRIRK
jgi:AraC family transcriptional regulator